MSGEDRDAPLCTRVLERLVDEGDVGSDRVLAEHLGSCVTCFRTMTELRDAPRLAEALRGAPPQTAQAAPDDRFWENLAIRTTAAAGAALRDPGSVGLDPVAPRPVDLHRSPAFIARGRRWSVSARGRVAVVATTVAAAAAFAVVARHPPAALSSREPAVVASGVVASAVRSTPDDETGEAADVADLDGTALRRLLDRLRTRAPAVLTSFGAGEAPEASDTLGDDDRRVNDEVADLDGAALRRVASSLAGSAL